MPSKRLLLGLAVLMASAAVAAQAEPEVPKEKPWELHERLSDKCGQEWGFPGAIASCLLDHEKAFGKELDQAYNKALTLVGANKPLLRESQRHWLKYQESNCKLQEQITVDRMYKRNHWAHCLLRMTLERLEELRQLESDVEPF